MWVRYWHIHLNRLWESSTQTLQNPTLGRWGPWFKKVKHLWTLGICDWTAAFCNSVVTVLYSGAWISSKVHFGYLSPCLGLALKLNFRHPGILASFQYFKAVEEFLHLIQEIRLWYVSLEFTETCPATLKGSCAALWEDPYLPGPLGMSTGPDTFLGLRSYGGGSITGVELYGCQKNRSVEIILVCICAKLKQCRGKSGYCVYHMRTLPMYEQAAFYCLAAEYVISPGKG